MPRTTRLPARSSLDGGREDRFMAAVGAMLQNKAERNSSQFVSSFSKVFIFPGFGARSRDFFLLLTPVIK